MTSDQLKAFIEKVKGDESLQLRLKEVQNEADWSAIAKEEGFNFSLEDLQKNNDEISEDELEGVAGGFTVTWFKLKRCHFDSLHHIFEC